MFWFYDDDPTPKYERQLKGVDYLVMNELKKKHHIFLSKKQLIQVLEVLHDYQVIE